MNSEKAVKAIKALTVQEAVISKTPSIARINMVHERAAYDTLVFLIADVVEFLNVGNTMNSAQTLQTAKLILEDVETKNLKPDDFKVCFDNAKRGIYGKSYNRIDGQIIFEWLRAYCLERMDVVENLKIQEHVNQTKENENPSEVNPEGQKKVIDILKANLPGDRSPEAKKTGLIEKSPRDLFIQKCFTEFQQIHSKTPFKPEQKPKKSEYDLQDRYDETIPLILHTWVKDGKEVSRPVDQVEYTQIKLTQYDSTN